MNKNELKGKLAKLKAKVSHFSEKEKDEFTSAYNEAVKVLKSKEISGKQKEVELNKTFGKYTKKIIAVVMSAIMLTSPMMLAGCDENTSIIGSNTNQTTTTNNSGIEDDVSTYEPIDAEHKEKVLQIFDYWDINRVVEKEYSTMIRKALVDHRAGRGIEWGNSTQLYLAIEQMLQDDVEYAIDVKLKKSNQGADIKFYRKGTDTATFIITKNGKTYYNGIVANKVYCEGSEYISKDIPIFLNEETAGILSQLNSKDLGKLYGNELLSYFFLSGIPANSKNYYYYAAIKEVRSKNEEKWGTISGDFEACLFGRRVDIEAVYDTDGVLREPARTIYTATDVSLYANISYPEKTRRDDWISCTARPALTSFAVEAGEESHKETLDRFAKHNRKGYRVAEMQIDYSPQNIILPTTEAELSK